MNIDAIYNSLFEKSHGEDQGPYLSELAEKYPYCQALHFARLKWLKETNNVAYNDYLKLAAAYSGNREYLFTIIHEQKQVMEHAIIPPSLIVEDANPETSFEPLPETIINVSEKSDEERLQQIIDQRLRELNLVKSAPSPEFKIDDFMLQLESQNSDETVVESEVKEVETLNVVDEPFEVETAIDDESRTLEIPVNAATPGETSIANTKSNTEIQESVSSLEKEISAAIEKLAQGDDPIDQLIGQNLILERLSPEIQEEVNMEEVKIDGNHTFTEWLRAVKKPAASAKFNRNASTAEPQSDIIEKFIREEPRITPARSTFYSPINMAKQSILERNDLVSETLAKIYTQQSNYEKAISAYEKLSLLHPEKSAYFAALIIDLKQKQKL